MTPRWTYSKANADQWRELFDSVISTNEVVRVPLKGNAKSLLSLKVRICDALKWLSDQWTLGANSEFEKYALLKRGVCFEAGTLDAEEFLDLKKKQRRTFGTISTKSEINFALSLETLTSLFEMLRNPALPMSTRVQCARVIVKHLTNQDAGEKPALPHSTEHMLMQAKALLEESPESTAV